MDGANNNTLSKNSAASDAVAKRATSASRNLCPMQIFGRRNKLGKIAITKSIGDHSHPLARDVRTGAHYYRVKPNTVLHYYKTDLEWGKKTKQTDKAQKYEVELALKEAKSINTSQVGLTWEDVFGSSNNASEPSGVQYMFSVNTFNGNVVNGNAVNSLTPAEQNQDLHIPKKRRTVEDKTTGNTFYDKLKVVIMAY
ncbi:hypothetical protein [Parasitella parasitica]|uniref:FAR1 domain-containing protein n=1 Tax=Parasitella parasitica TaxID=35722 RepID=A0A0B7N1W9_9FUNG|nr:hypothetical protein [Parasitella parasitica]